MDNPTYQYYPLDRCLYADCASVSDPDSLIPDPAFWFRQNADPEGFDVQNFTAEKNFVFFLSIIASYSSLGLHKGRLSLQPSKENIQKFKTWNFLTFLIFYFRWSTDLMESGSKRDPDPKHWIVQSAISTISPVLPHIMWAGAVAYMWAIFCT